MANFAIIGVGGYIAPKHLKAIKDAGGELLISNDIHDGVGILDSYFPKTEFYKDFDKFSKSIWKIQSYTDIDYLVVCSPNYLHKEHIKFGLTHGMNVICEKPLVLTPDDLYELHELEKETGKKVYTILQLRLHPLIIDLKNKVSGLSDLQVYLKYVTLRGHWYRESWKGDVKKSGGLSTNIGIHFFDMLQWVFGDTTMIKRKLGTDACETGIMETSRAEITWELFIAGRHNFKNGETAVRKLHIQGMYDIDFSEGFTELHSKSYEEILQGRGFTIEDAMPSIKIVSEIRNE